jgi:hypothetical protein
LRIGFSLFVSLVYCAESTVRWFVVREKHCWMAADSAVWTQTATMGGTIDLVTGFLHVMRRLTD